MNVVQNELISIDKITIDPAIKAYSKRTIETIRKALTEENKARKNKKLPEKKSVVTTLSSKALFISYYTGLDGNKTTIQIICFQRGGSDGHLSSNSQAHASYIAANYDDARRDVPVVAYLEEYGVFVVIDGANRIQAEILLGFEEHEVRIVSDITPQQMAYYFAHQDDGKIRVDGIHKYIASYKAGETTEVDIHDALNKHHVAVKTRKCEANSLRTITSINNVYTIYRTNGTGKDNLELFLKLWEESEWNQIPGSYKSYFLLVAVAAVKYCKYNDKGYIRLKNKMKETPPIQFLNNSQNEFVNKTGKNGYGSLTHYTKAIIDGVNLL